MLTSIPFVPSYGVPSANPLAVSLDVPSYSPSQGFSPDGVTAKTCRIISFDNASRRRHFSFFSSVLHPTYEEGRARAHPTYQSIWLCAWEPAKI